MSWHNENITLKLMNNKGEEIGDLEVTKAEFVAIYKKSVDEGISISDCVTNLLIEGYEEWEIE